MSLNLNKIKTPFYILLFFFLGSLSSIAWGQVSFEAVCNATQVLTDSPFEVTFRLRNAHIKTLQPPSFNGLRAQGPNIGQSFSHVNGVSSTNQTYTYFLVANKPGTYKIGAAKVLTTKGQTIRTKPFTVKVLEKSATVNSDVAGKVFLRTEVSNTDAVVGEQVTVDIKIYTQMGIEQIEIIKEPSFENVFSHYLRSFSGEAKVEVVNGAQYTTKILRRLAVFPSKPGIIIVEPAIVDIGIASNKGGGIFNPFRLTAYTLKSMPVELKVKELGGPASGFSGVVGRYLMQAHLDKNEITSDDVLQLTLRIRGEGDIKQVLSPNLGVNKKYFDQFKPNINEDIREGGGLLGGIKEFQYVLTPKALGEYSINPKFTYFDSEQKRFITIDTTIKVRVVKGNSNLPSKAERDAMKDGGYEIEEVDENLMAFRAPQKEAQFVSADNSLFLGSTFFCILAILPFLSLACFWKWKDKQDQLENIPDSERKRNNASSGATLRLKNARDHLNEGNSKEFFSEISHALLGFVSDKYNIPKVELTKNNVRQQLVKQEIATDKIDSLLSILQACDMALFAGIADEASMGKTYKDSEELIQLMEK